MKKIRVALATATVVLGAPASAFAYHVSHCCGNAWCCLHHMACCFH